VQFDGFCVVRASGHFGRIVKTEIDVLVVGGYLRYPLAAGVF